MSLQRNCITKSHAWQSESRQGLYKRKSPAWKETYRNRCLERLRENRSKCHAARRSILQEGMGPDVDEEFDEDSKAEGGWRGGGEGKGYKDTQCQGSTTLLSIDEIMEQEWDQMKNEMKHNNQNPAIDYRIGNNESSYIDSMVSLYEEICSELRKEIQSDLQREEEQLLRLQEVYEAELLNDEDELCLAVENLSTEEVICPLCEKSSLIENKGVIFCSCGLRIDTEQDCISLRNIRTNLCAGVSEHSAECEAKPEFSLTQKFGITNILMACQECDFLFIIV